MWKLTEHKCSRSSQELKVKMLIKEMVDGTYATTAGEFENHFKIRIAEIPRTNNFSADLLYKVTPRNLKSVEVWKMTVSGDFNYKMFTLLFVDK